MMIAPLKNGCYTIKSTKRMEVYQLGEKIFKYIYRNLKLKELKGNKYAKLLIK